VARYSRPMQQDLAARRLVIDAVQAAPRPGHGVQRLAATGADGRRYLVDLHGVPGTDGAVAAAPGSPVFRAGDVLGDLPPGVRAFVHEDLSRRALELIPPAPVPWKQRLLWSTAFALLRTRVGRDWLARRHRG
jgi:hypothetical protein